MGAMKLNTMIATTRPITIMIPNMLHMCARQLAFTAFSSSPVSLKSYAYNHTMNTKMHILIIIITFLEGEVKCVHNGHWYNYH